MNIQGNQRFLLNGIILNQTTNQNFNNFKSNYTPPGGRKGKIFGQALTLFKKNIPLLLKLNFQIPQLINIIKKH